MDAALRSNPLGLPGWYSQAECAGMDPEVFEDERFTSSALAVCSICPVQLRCLQVALLDPFASGVWGGTTVLTRRSIKNRAARRRRAMERERVRT